MAEFPRTSLSTSSAVPIPHAVPIISQAKSFQLGVPPVTASSPSLPAPIASEKLRVVGDGYLSGDLYLPTAPTAGRR
jgi:hypothetical protein